MQPIDFTHSTHPIPVSRHLFTPAMRAFGSSLFKRSAATTISGLSDLQKGHLKGALESYKKLVKNRISQTIKPAEVGV